MPCLLLLTAFWHSALCLAGSQLEPLPTSRQSGIRVQGLGSTLDKGEHTAETLPLTLTRAQTLNSSSTALALAHKVFNLTQVTSNSPSTQPKHATDSAERQTLLKGFARSVKAADPRKGIWSKNIAKKSQTGSRNDQASSGAKQRTVVFDRRKRRGKGADTKHKQHKQSTDFSDRTDALPLTAQDTSQAAKTGSAALTSGSNKRASSNSKVAQGVAAAPSLCKNRTAQLLKNGCKKLVWFTALAIEPFKPSDSEAKKLKTRTRLVQYKAALLSARCNAPSLIPYVMYEGGKPGDEFSTWVEANGGHVIHHTLSFLKVGCNRLFGICG